MQFHSVSKLGLLAGILLLCVHCQKESDYSVVPQLGYDGYAVEHGRDVLGNQQWRVIVRLSFADGDGDLGFYWYNDQANPAFFSLNYKQYYQQVDSFFRFFYSADTIGIADSMMRIPFVVPSVYHKSVKGWFEITIEYPIPAAPNPRPMPYDTVKYEFSVFDRAGHLSNVVTTPVILISEPQAKPDSW